MNRFSLGRSSKPQSSPFTSEKVRRFRQGGPWVGSETSYGKSGESPCQNLSNVSTERIDCRETFGLEQIPIPAAIVANPTPITGRNH